jgi:hypothetical protein
MRNDGYLVLAIMALCAACGASDATPTNPDAGVTPPSGEGGPPPRPDGGPMPPRDSGGGGGDASGDVLPLHLAFTFHLEGQSLVASQTAFDRYIANIRSTAVLFHSHGARPTWEGAEIVEKSKSYGVNILKELEDGGDAIGLHANGVGYVPNDKNYTTEKMEAELVKQRTNIDALGVNVRHVSNICSTADWVRAVQTAKLEAVTGVVEYCLKSLPDPGSAASCAAPNECHTPYPKETKDSISSWYAASGATWTTHASSGTLILPTSGSVPCSAEEASGVVSPTQCSYASDDVTATLAQLDIAVASRQAGVVHSHIFVASFGQTPNADVVGALLGRIKTEYIDTGKAKWVTIPELIDLRKAQK